MCVCTHVDVCGCVGGWMWVDKGKSAKKARKMKKKGNQIRFDKILI